MPPRPALTDDAPPDCPNRAYFRANEGRWTSPFRFVITDSAAFFRSPMGFLDRIRALSMAWLPRLLGPLVLETSVHSRSRGDQGIVIHTTRLRKFGITLYEAIETFTLHDNGQDVAIERVQRLAPAFSYSREVGESRAEVDPSATRAVYQFPFMGSPMRQVATVEGDGVRIHQETAWSRADAFLHRLA